MKTVSLSPENEHFLQAQVAAGHFPTIDAALDAAVGSLRSGEEFRMQIQEGLADLEAGRYTDYDDLSLGTYFDTLIAYAARRQETLDENA